MYQPLLYFLLFGALLPIPVYLAIKKWPNSWARFINIPVILNGASYIPPATGINYSSWFICGFIFRGYRLPVEAKVRNALAKLYLLLIGRVLAAQTSLPLVVQVQLHHFCSARVRHRNLGYCHLLHPPAAEVRSTDAVSQVQTADLKSAKESLLKLCSTCRKWWGNEVYKRTADWLGVPFMGEQRTRAIRCMM